MAIVKSKLVKDLAKNYPNFPKKDLEKLVNILLNEIKNSLKKGERVELRGFGVFYTNTQKQSIRRNPRTGEVIQIAGYKQPRFKVGQKLKDAVNK